MSCPIKVCAFANRAVCIHRNRSTGRLQFLEKQNSSPSLSPFLKGIARWVPARPLPLCYITGGTI